MELKWTSKALAELVPLHHFLAPASSLAAARAVKELTQSPRILLTKPRIGEPLVEFEPREVRRLLIGHYEMRYEIVNGTVYVLRLWHTREDR